MSELLYNTELNQGDLIKYMPQELADLISLPTVQVIRSHHIAFSFIAAATYLQSVINVEDGIRAFMADDFEMPASLAQSLANRNSAQAASTEKSDEYFALGVDPLVSPYNQGLIAIATKVYAPETEVVAVGRLIDHICGGCPIATAHCYRGDGQLDKIVESNLPNHLTDSQTARSYEVQMKHSGEVRQVFSMSKSDFKRMALQRILHLKSNEMELIYQGVAVPQKVAELAPGRFYNIIDMESLRSGAFPGFKESMELIDPKELVQFVTKEPVLFYSEINPDLNARIDRAISAS